MQKNSKSVDLEKENPLLLSYQTGEIFDEEGHLYYKFPGGYPLILPDRQFLVYQDKHIHKFNATGDLIYRIPQEFTHDWDYDENGNVYFLTIDRFKKDRRVIRTTNIKVIDKSGLTKSEFKIRDFLDSIQESLGVLIEPHFFASGSVMRRFGIRLTCNCWELEHLNHLKILKENVQLSDGQILKKGDIFTSFPMHGIVLTMDPSSFKINWKVHLSGINFFHTPVITPWNTLLVFVNNFRSEDSIVEKSAIVEFDLTDGKEIWKYELNQNMYSPINGSIDIDSNGDIIFSTMIGEIYLLKKRQHLTLFLDLKKRYFERQTDFYRIGFIERKSINLLTEERN